MDLRLSSSFCVPHDNVIELLVPEIEETKMINSSNLVIQQANRAPQKKDTEISTTNIHVDNAQEEYDQERSDLDDDDSSELSFDSEESELERRQERLQNQQPGDNPLDSDIENVLKDHLSQSHKVATVLKNSIVKQNAKF